MKKRFLLLSLSLLFAGGFSMSLINNSSFKSAKAFEEGDEYSQSIGNDSCTIMYVGKDVSEDGLPIIARTGDGSSPLVYHTVKVYPKDLLANKIYEGKNGFQWPMPNHTYRFTGFPRSLSMGISLHWDVSTMNECGVAISGTLSCYSDSNRVLVYDPFVENGISEDNIAGLLAATSSTAKEAMEILANVIDQKGSAEANAVMAIDQDEAWYMEIYSGHQYCAIKLPSNKATTIGNEFMLNTLAMFSDEEIITSLDLFNLPKEHGFAVFEGGTADKNMHLFNTYARPLSYIDDDSRMTIDASHMRTWRGFNLFACDDEQVDYETTAKYPSFFTPKRKLSNADVFSFYRDRYEDLLENPDTKYDIFRNNAAANRLRCVGTETSYQVHVIKVHPDLPKSMAVEAWINMGNATGAPFVPFNNLMEKFPEEYTHVVENYGSDEKSAQYIYRRISAIANSHPKEYSLPIQKFWNIYEDIWNKQYSYVIEEAKSLLEKESNRSAGKLLNDLLFEIQTRALDEADYLYRDLLTKYMVEQKAFNPNITPFVPKTSIKKFSQLYGYEYDVNKGIITLKLDDKVVTINCGEGLANKSGTISCEELSEDILVNIENDEYYGDISLLKKYIADGHELVKIEKTTIINKINEDKNLPFIIIPILIVLIAAIVVLSIILVKTNKSK